MKELYFTPQNIPEVSRKIVENSRRFTANRFFEFNKNNAALLVLDMQDFFLNERSHAFVPSSRAIIKPLLNLIQTSFSHNMPVIFTQHQNTPSNAGNMFTWWKRTLAPDNSLVNINKAFSGYFDQPLIKSQYDAFYNTELNENLNSMGKSQLIICGVMTNLCCETTCRSAFIYGYQVFFPADTTATYNLEMHQSTFNNMAFGFAEILLGNDLIKLINNGQ